jgi:hypothetical protein
MNNYYILLYASRMNDSPRSGSIHIHISVVDDDEKYNNIVEFMNLMFFIDSNDLRWHI